MIALSQTHLASYTQKESERVQNRMAKVASLYDAARDGVGPGLAVFEGELNPTQFREQLRRSLDFKMRFGHELVFHYICRVLLNGFPACIQRC